MKFIKDIGGKLSMLDTAGFHEATEAEIAAYEKQEREKCNRIEMATLRESLAASQDLAQKFKDGKLTDQEYIELMNERSAQLARLSDLEKENEV